MNEEDFILEDFVINLKHSFQIYIIVMKTCKYMYVYNIDGNEICFPTKVVISNPVVNRNESTRHNAIMRAKYT